MRPTIALRAYEERDYPFFRDLVTGAETMAFMDGALSSDAACRLFEGIRSGKDGSCRAWAVVEGESPRLVGHGALQAVAGSEAEELLVIVHETERGRGFGRAAVELLVERAFRRDEAARVIATVDENHVASRALLAATGFHLARLVRDDGPPYGIYERWLPDPPSRFDAESLRDLPIDRAATRKVLRRMRRGLEEIPPSARATWARVGSRVAGLHRRLGELDEAEALFERSLEAARDLGEAGLLVVVLIRYAHLRHWKENWAGAEAMFDEAEALIDHGRLEEARRLLRQALDLRRRKGQDELVASTGLALRRVERDLP